MYERPAICLCVILAVSSSIDSSVVKTYNDTDSQGSPGITYQNNRNDSTLGESPKPIDKEVCPRMVSREEWGAQPPKGVELIQKPVGYVVIHHTYIPSVCWTTQECRDAMKSMQKYHQDVRGWLDIGYNFAIGGDGRIYVGRGWGRVGAHAPPFNNNSIGITLIGDWRVKLPTEDMLSAAKSVIQCGVETGLIAPDYKLIGHRQARTVTECPGEALFNEIKKWPQWYPEYAYLSTAPPRGTGTDTDPSPHDLQLNPLKHSTGSSSSLLERMRRSINHHHA